MTIAEVILGIASIVLWMTAAIMSDSQDKETTKSLATLALALIVSALWFFVIIHNNKGW